MHYRLTLTFEQDREDLADAVDTVNLMRRTGWATSVTAAIASLVPHVEREDLQAVPTVLPVDPPQPADETSPDAPLELTPAERLAIRRARMLSSAELNKWINDNGLGVDAVTARNAAARLLIAARRAEL